MKLSLKRIEGLEARGSVAVKVTERYRNDSFEFNFHKTAVMIPKQ